jgi:hypothetical protein
MSMPMRNTLRFVVSRKTTVVVFGIVFVIVVLVVAFGQRLTQWPFRHALPSNAQDIHEWFREDGFLPDYAYKLKARISDKEFHAYVKRFELTPHHPDRQYSGDIKPWLHWRSQRPAIDWWDPSESLDNTFVRQVGDSWTYAKWERGYLYLKSLDH